VGSVERLLVQKPAGAGCRVRKWQDRNSRVALGPLAQGGAAVGSARRSLIKSASSVPKSRHDIHKMNPNLATFTVDADTRRVRGVEQTNSALASGAPPIVVLPNMDHLPVDKPGG
jgi:hypothetical protein